MAPEECGQDSGKALGLGGRLWGVCWGEVEWVELARLSLTWTHVCPATAPRPQHDPL